MKRFLFSFTFWTAVAGVCRAQTTPVATPASIGALSLANRVDVADSFPAVCGQAVDATTPFLTMLSTVEAVNAPLVVNCPIYFASPQNVSVPSTVNLIFEGTGNISWNFGSVTSVTVPTKGRAFTSLPTANITGNATLGAITMALYQGTIVGGGSGYVAGDVVSLSGGTGTQASYTLASGNLSGGSIVSLPIDPTSRGAYTTLPSGTITLTGGSGTGATITATWWLTGIAVASGGTYSSATIPTITISGGSPSVNAIAIPVGQKPTISAKIVAGTQQNIFSGYAWLAGAPNNNDCYATWFGASVGSGYPSAAATDSTQAIQAAIESCQVVRFPAGWYNIASTIYGENFTKLIGPSGFTVMNGGGGLPSANSGAGALFWGTGTGTAVVETRPVQEVQNFDLSNIAIAAASAASYSWVVLLNGPISDNWQNFSIKNNQATGGGLYWEDETPIGASFDAQLYGQHWSNKIDNAVIAAAGTTLDIDVSDGNISNSYFTGGTGVKEEGAANRWSNIKIDNSSGDCLLIQPAWWTSNSDVMSAINIQCPSGAVNGIHFANGTHPAGLALNTIIAGLEINGENVSNSDLYFDNVNQVQVSAQVGGSNSATNVAANGSSDNITVFLSGDSGSASLLGSHSMLYDSINNAISGGSTLTLGTNSGAGIQILSKSGSGSPLIVTPGKAGSTGATINVQSVGITLSTSGSAVLALPLAGPTGLYQHLASFSGTPTIACSTGTCTLSAHATDTKGTVTEGTLSTGFTLTFASVYATAPDCGITPDNGATLTNVTVGTASIIGTNAAATGDKFTYVCFQ